MKNKVNKFNYLSKNLEDVTDAQRKLVWIRWLVAEHRATSALDARRPKLNKHNNLLNYPTLHNKNIQFICCRQIIMFAC